MLSVYATKLSGYETLYSISNLLELTFDAKINKIFINIWKKSQAKPQGEGLKCFQAFEN